MRRAAWRKWRRRAARMALGLLVVGWYLAARVRYALGAGEARP